LFCHSPDPPRGDPPPGAGAAVATSLGARRRRGDVAATRSMDSAVGLGKIWKGDLDDDILLMATRNPRVHTVEGKVVEILSFAGFGIHPRWCRISSIKSLNGTHFGKGEIKLDATLLLAILSDLPGKWAGVWVGNIMAPDFCSLFVLRF